MIYGKYYHNHYYGYRGLPPIDFQAGIDTIEVKSSTYLDRTKPYLSHDNYRKLDMSEEEPQYKYRFNPDKTLNDLTNNSDIQKQRIETYEEYQTALEFMMNDTGLKNAVKTRIDFRFDEYRTDYQHLFKISKVILLLLAMTYKVKQTYQSFDLMTAEIKTARIQNNRIEAEFYNKLEQEPQSGIKCRLELRSKALNDTDQEDGKELREFLKWLERLNKSATWENFATLTADLNSYLYDLYLTEIKDHLVWKPSQFIIKYSDYFLTARQIDVFFAMCGKKNPQSSAAQFRRIYPIPLIRYKDITQYIENIRAAANRYFAQTEDTPEQTAQTSKISEQQIVNNL